MERVEGLLRKLRLSEAEMAGLRISEQQMEVGDEVDRDAVEPKVVAKVLSQKLVSAEGLKQALGPIWCPLRGIRCNRRGENIFMITLLQNSGKKKALDCGPWMFNNDLVIVEDYDPEKSVEDYSFTAIPVWVRILKLPLGKMNKATGEMIGKKMGAWLEADVGEDDFAFGEHLRIKVKIDITKPLMRGMMIQIGEDGRSKWCPFEYEFLPEFCYICGIIGHDDKSCLLSVGKGEEKQFGSWLRAHIPKKQNSAERQRWSSGGGSGSGGRSYDSGERHGAGSNSLSWRKDDSNKTASDSANDKKDGGNDEVLNTANKLGGNIPEPPRKSTNCSKMLDMVEKKAKSVAVQAIPVQTVLNPSADDSASRSVENQVQGLARSNVEEAKKDKMKLKGNFFQRRSRTASGSQEVLGVKLGSKRSPEHMDVEEESSQAVKRGRTEFAEDEEVTATTKMNAGLQGQPCEFQ